MDTQYVERVRRDCLETAGLISAEFSRISKIRSVVDSISLFVGVIGIAISIVSLSPSGHLYIASNAGNIITIIASIVLIFQFSMDRIFFKDPPSRFRDFAFYIGLYPQKIANEMAKKAPDWKKIEAWVDLANTNLNDAATVWPHLVIRS